MPLDSSYLGAPFLPEDLQENTHPTVFVVFSYGYNYSKIIKVFCNKDRANNFVINFNRSSFDKAYVEEVEIE